MKQIEIMIMEAYPIRPFKKYLEFQYFIDGPFYKEYDHSFTQYLKTTSSYSAFIKIVKGIEDM